ncbi:CaiB/BaiF CoA transferase family protein [Sphingobium ummariense]
MKLPLNGVRVIDLTSVAMGPFASQWLGDLGADVIKVESPAGDSTRYTGPTRERGMSALFLGSNRNKRSVVLDVKHDQDRDTLLTLIKGADIFMHSVRPQKLRKLGLDPGALLQRNPRLVYAGLHGFAEQGPYGGRPAYDDIIQGMSGSAALMQRLGGEPRYFPTIMADKTSGLIACIAILSALRGRDASGEGCFVEIPMFESMVSFNLLEHLYGLHFEPPLGPPVYPRVMSPSRRPFATRDGYVCLMPYTDRHWAAFFEAVGAPEIAADKRFADITLRTENIDALYAIAAEFLTSRSSAEWLALFDRLEIPAAPILEVDQIMDDAHLVATNFFQTVQDQRMGTVRYTGIPVLIDGERPPVRMAPRLGEHNEEILGEIVPTDVQPRAREACARGDE